MALSIGEFRQRLIDSGLVSEADLQQALNVGGQPCSKVEQFARRLIENDKLTACQVKQIYQGRGKSLRLGNYILLEKLGQGGMGLVYKARHEVMNRVVALKTLAPEITQRPDLVARFRREVQVSAKLEHPHVVSALDAAQSGRTHYLVMQFVEGEDLSQRVHRDGPLPVVKALDCIRQAATGLEYAHQQGVVHRDIKPANLLLDRTGQIKVLDLGLARIVDEKLPSAEMTSTGTVMGTVDYMAPEQAEDTRQADARSDIYSLGCTLFFLLTGRPTFEGATVIQRMLAHREADVPSLASFIDDATPQLDALFRKMVAKNPAERFQSMAELMTAIGQVHQTQHSLIQPARSATEDEKFNAFLLSIDDPAADTPAIDSFAETIATRKGETPPQARKSRETSQSAKRKPPREKSTLASSKVYAMLGGGGGLVLLALVVTFAVLDREDDTTPQQTQTPPQTLPRDSVATVPTTPQTITAQTEHAEDTSNSPLVDIPTMSVPSEHITGLEFDGVDDYAVAPDFRVDDTNPLTIEAWLTCTAPKAPTNPVMLMGPNWMTIFHTGEHWGIGRLNNGQSILRQAPDSLQLGERTHVAGVWTGDELLVFINGGLIANTVDLPYQLLPTESGIYLGGAPAEQLPPGENDRFFAGVIHQVRITQGVRYTESFTPDAQLAVESETAALYALDQSAGRQLEDQSAHARHGTVHGAVWRNAARD